MMTRLTLAVAGASSCVFEGLLTEAHTQDAHYTDCNWGASLSLTISLLTLFVSCVLRCHGLLSLHASCQQVTPESAASELTVSVRVMRSVV